MKFLCRKYVCITIVCFLFSLTTVQCVLTTYLGIAGGLAAMKYFYDKSVCSIDECCHEPDANVDYINFKDVRTDLTNLLKKRLFGQHLVVELVPNIIYKHLNTKQSKKPLVISFNGWTGSGKSHTSVLIAEAMFKKGIKSKFVLHVDPLDLQNFNAKDWKKELTMMVHHQASICKYSLIIVEEADKFPQHVFDVFSMFMNYEKDTYKHLTFLFLSNTGGNVVVSKLERHMNKGKLRGEIQLSDLEHLINSEVFETVGGMKGSQTISRFMIDHFIPFLPLERSHVRLCILEYIKRAYPQLQSVELMVEKVLQYIEFTPPDERLFSVSGCKQVERKTDLLVY